MYVKTAGMVSQTLNPVTSVPVPFETLIQYVMVSPNTAVPTFTDFMTVTPLISVAVRVGENTGVCVSVTVTVYVNVFVTVMVIVEDGGGKVFVGVMVRVTVADGQKSERSTVETIVGDA